MMTRLFSAAALVARADCA